MLGREVIIDWNVAIEAGLVGFPVGLNKSLELLELVCFY